MPFCWRGRSTGHSTAFCLPGTIFPPLVPHILSGPLSFTSSVLHWSPHIHSLIFLVTYDHPMCLPRHRNAYQPCISSKTLPFRICYGQSLTNPTYHLLTTNFTFDPLINFTLTILPTPNNSPSDSAEVEQITIQGYDIGEDILSVTFLLELFLCLVICKQLFIHKLYMFILKKLF